MPLPPDHFTVVVHAKLRIIEVRYPARPSLESYEKYEKEIRAAISAMNGTWDCLVDQTALKALAPEFPPRIAVLNHWAREHGMRRTARVIADSAIGELQGMRILRDSGVKDVGSIFKTRDEAWRAITTPSKA
ncbi:MAG: STAS/SEC14 domain-containing protein [Deltaproteobacteria bacterium]|nr:STAS/SEC14 domain-containing protein [Deltaproteobacteria bacterium]